MFRPKRPRHAWWVLSVVPVALTACGSGPGHPVTAGSGTQGNSVTSSAQLEKNDATILGDLTTYLSSVNACKSQSSPVVCVEAADRTLGGQIHDYANKLASGASDGAKAADVTAARNSAQLLANQANYNQVLNTFNVNNAISSLRAAVAKVQADLG
jgi:UDP-N-acetylglucosamine 2-epimerase